ncbi:RHS repeat-associated core domain-containing protein [Allochromatium vinosum]|uniref:RHS repeat-associated core domain-containing protein n=1 Tax=Allochromatium vinosum TaxID=1049 RepID=UPI001903913B
MTWTYARNQVGEIAGHSWSNDAYQWGGLPNGTRAYSVNGLNQYTQAAGATLSYDANANLTGDGTWTYGYDLDNRLKSAAKTELSATLAYDAEGRLRQSAIGGTTTNLAYDGTDLVAEYNSAGRLLRRYVHGPGIDAPLVVYEGSATTNKTWLYADHLGSIVAQASSAGTRTALYRYGPFGEPDVTSGQRFRYTGQPLIGALGLYYYKARFYSPSLGRFLQTDPIGYADDLNLYAYAGNSPISFNDPSGLLAADAAKLAGKLGEAVDDYVQGGYGRQFAQAVQDGDTSAALTYFAASFLSIGMTVESGGSSSALRGVAQSAAKGEAGRFADLAARGVKGDNLTPHHMPQAAAGFTSRADGGALMMPEAEHILTRTYGFKGAVTAKQEAGMKFRAVLAKDMGDVRSIGGAQYNQGLQELLSYYRTNFPELMMKR